MARTGNTWDSWSSLVTDFELAITAQGLKVHTVANYSRDVSRFSKHLLAFSWRSRANAKNSEMLST